MPLRHGHAQVYIWRARVFESVVNAHADRDALALGLPSPPSLLFEELLLRCVVSVISIKPKRF